MVERTEDLCRIQLKDVRLSFPALFKAKAFGKGKGEGEPAYSAEFLIPKDTSLGKKLIDRIEDAIEEAKYVKWGDDKKKWPKISKDKPFFKDGDDPDYARDETEGMMICSARNKKKPRVLGIDKEDIYEEDGIIYGGCYVDAIVRVWAQDNDYGKRVNCSLEAVRFRRDGEPFGAAPVDPDEFEDIEDEGRGERRRSSRGRDRDDDGDDDDRGSRRRGRDDDDDNRGSRRRGRDDDDDDRGGRRSRDDDDDRGSRRGRDDDDDRGGRRSRDEDDDRRSRRGRDRDDEDDRSSRRGRDRDDDGDRGSRRSRRDEDDEDRPSRNSRSSRRGDEDDDI